MSGCLDDATALDLLEGKLDGESLSSVDEHIDRCPVCQAILVTLARATGARVQHEAGQRLGRYELCERIGQGSFGQVWRAHDEQLGRDVALKLRPDASSLDSGSVAEHLRREARAMAKLTHPHVVTVYDAGTLELADGRSETFLAMELVEGGSARAWLAERSEPAAALRTLLGPGRGLAAAHRAGLVHRDFKPENVLFDREGRAKVTDFGLASGVIEPGIAMDGEPDLGRSVVRTGRLVGTPAYMAPEQLAGQPATTASDLFAYCAVIYEALALTRPFPAESLAELAARQREDPAEGTRQLDPCVRAVLLRGLAVEPKDRFATMEQLLAALEAASAAGSRPQPTRRWVGVAAVIAAAALVTAAIVVNGSRTESLVPEPEVPNVAAHPLCGAPEGEAFSELDTEIRAAASALGTGGTPFVKATSSWRRRAESARVQACASSDRTAIACLAGEAEAVAAVARLADRALPSGALAAAVHALPDPGFCGLSQGVSSSWGLSSQDAEPLVIDALVAFHRARALLLVGASDASDAVLDALELAERADEPSLMARAMLLSATSAVEAGDMVEAERMGQDALAQAQRGGDAHLEAEAWHELAAIASTSARPAIALERCRHADSRLAGQPWPELSAGVSNTRGQALTELARFDDANDALGQALTAREQTWGNEHPSVARVLTNLGNLARAEGDYPQARAHHERALAIDVAAFGADHPALARHHHNLARIELLEGSPSAAEQRYRSALRLERTAFGDGAKHPAIARTHNSLGLVYLAMSDEDAAERAFVTALDQSPEASSLETAHARFNLGQLWIRQGEVEKGLEALDAALATAERRLGEAHPLAVRIQLARGLGFRAAGQRERAVVELERAERLAEALADGGAILAKVEEALAAVAVGGGVGATASTPPASTPASPTPAGPSEVPPPSPPPPPPEPAIDGSYMSSPSPK